jgi:hypothetical protein
MYLFTFSEYLIKGKWFLKLIECFTLQKRTITIIRKMIAYLHGFQSISRLIQCLNFIYWRPTYSCYVFKLKKCSRFPLHKNLFSSGIGALNYPRVPVSCSLEDDAVHGNRSKIFFFSMEISKFIWLNYDLPQHHAWYNASSCYAKLEKEDLIE